MFYLAAIEFMELLIPEKPTKTPGRTHARIDEHKQSHIHTEHE